MYLLAMQAVTYGHRKLDIMLAHIKGKRKKEQVNNATYTAELLNYSAWDRAEYVNILSFKHYRREKIITV